MNNTIDALRNLYVALGGEAEDVANLVIIPELIDAIASLEGGGGGGGKHTITANCTNCYYYGPEKFSESDGTITVAFKTNEELTTNHFGRDDFDVDGADYIFIPVQQDSPRSASLVLYSITGDVTITANPTGTDK